MERRAKGRTKHSMEKDHFWNTKIFGMAVTKCEERGTWDLLSDLEGH